MFVTKRTVIIGDFNFHSGESNVLTKQLKVWKFSQLISEATHEKGYIIDHAYLTEDLLESATCDLHYVYYSDHQGICLNIL